MSLKMISRLLYHIEAWKFAFYRIEEEKMKELRIEWVENNQWANTVGEDTGRHR